ncbi:MAG: aminotransferase, partial [Parvibaculaceae bacterium]
GWTDLEQRDARSVIHPFTPVGSTRSDPGSVIASGEGIYVFDQNGNRFIEGLSGLFNASLGFSEKRLVEAAMKQLSRLPVYHTFAGMTTEPVVELAERLLQIAPVPMNKAFFACSGSEANDTAVKTIWYYFNSIGKPKKKKIISRRKSYHGMTLASASLTGVAANHAEFDLPLGRFLHVEDPNYYVNSHSGESEADFAARLAADLESLIVAEGPETIAAFFADPVSAPGGMVVPPEGYFEKIQAVLKKHDVLFVADEVICGFGRTGRMFATETFDLRPDIMTMAKQLSSGYMPISAMLVNDRIVEGLEEQSRKRGSYSHGFTYGGHPVAAAVALETLNIYAERDIVGHVQRTSPLFQSRAHALAAHPLVGCVRGIGLLSGFELVKDKMSRERFPQDANIAGQLATRCKHHGILTRGGDDILTLSPPLVITAKQVDDLFDRLERAFDDTLEWAKREGLLPGS